MLTQLVNVDHNALRLNDVCTFIFHKSFRFSLSEHSGIINGLLFITVFSDKWVTSYLGFKRKRNLEH